MSSGDPTPTGPTAVDAAQLEAADETQSPGKHFPTPDVPATDDSAPGWADDAFSAIGARGTRSPEALR